MTEEPWIVEIRLWFLFNEDEEEAYDKGDIGKNRHYRGEKCLRGAAHTADIQGGGSEASAEGL